jgi:ribosomal-protein-serine acetyltransferase
VESLDPTARTTDRLLLRPFERRDSAALLEAVRASLPELAQWLPWAHLRYGRSDAQSYIRESMRSWKEGKAYDLAIRGLEDPRRHLGNISVWFISRSFKTGEIGYWIRSDETGKGIGTEATRKALDIAFNELHLHRAILRIAIGNRASERVAEKLGFVREGVLREEIKVRGEWLDHSVWGMLEHERHHTGTRPGAEA